MARINEKLSDVEKPPETYLRVLVVELSKLSPDKAEHDRQYRELMDLMRDVQAVQNFFFDTWRAWHFARGSAEKIETFHREWAEHIERKGAKSDRPKLDIFATSAELQKLIYAAVVKRWPKLHTRVVALTLNRLNQLVGSAKSSRGNWPGWHSWLLYRESLPSFTSPCPVAFDRANSQIEPPANAADSFRLHLTLAREPVEGRDRKASIRWVATVWDKGRRMAGRKATLRKISNGDYTFAGSQVFQKKGKLFAAIAFKQPKPLPITSVGVALIRAGTTHPLTIRVGGRSRWIGGDGTIVGVIRSQLMAQRWSRQKSYRFCATSARKGHGIKRAMDVVTVLANRWRDFVRTCNRNLAVEACQKSVAAGCGVIVFVRAEKSRRFLSLSGREDSRDRSSWDWFGLEKILADKCVEFGLEFRKIEARTRQEQPPTKVASGQVGAAAI